MPPLSPDRAARRDALLILRARWMARRARRRTARLCLLHVRRATR